MGAILIKIAFLVGDFLGNFPFTKKRVFLRGLPHMTSAVGEGGGPQKEQNQLICDSDKGGGRKI